MLRVIAMQQTGVYQLVCTFNNGIVKTVNFADHWDAFSGPIFQCLRDPEFFETVILPPNSETIEWPNGADVAAEFLFNIGETIVSQQTDPVLSEMMG